MADIRRATIRWRCTRPADSRSGAQHHEGASTLHEGHTLAAYQQIFASMTQALIGGSAVDQGQRCRSDKEVGVAPGSWARLHLLTLPGLARAHVQ